MLLHAKNCSQRLKTLADTQFVLHANCKQNYEHFIAFLLEDGIVG